METVVATGPLTIEGSEIKQVLQTEHVENFNLQGSNRLDNANAKVMNVEGKSDFQIIIY